MAPRPDSGPKPGAAKPLDPELRRRLLLEARTPWRSLRRALWFALVASAAVGLATMALRVSAGGELPLSDLLIQLCAVAIFGTLIVLDRNREAG